MTAASPCARTAARISATAASTSSSTSRLAASRREKSAAKPGALASSLSGIGRLAEALDPAGDFLGAGLERDAIDDEARGDVGDALDLDEAVGAQRRSRLDEVDDLAAQADARRELHGAIELDALRLDAARREMPARDLRVLGGDAQLAPARRVVAAEILGRRRDDETAMPDLQVERRVDLGVFELHQHIVAGHADMRRPESDEGRDVEIAHADDV